MKIQQPRAALKVEHRFSSNDQQPQEDQKKKRPLPAFLAKNERKKPNIVQQAAADAVKVDEEVECAPLTLQQRLRIDDAVSQMAALTLAAKSKDVGQPAATSEVASRIFFDTNHDLDEEELHAGRSVNELPSFLQDSMNADDHEGNANRLPTLNESAIIKSKEVQELLICDSEVDRTRIDLDELDEAMLQDSHSRSLSDNTREETNHKKYRIVMPVYPSFKRVKVESSNLEHLEEDKKEVEEEEEEKKSAESNKNSDSGVLLSHRYFKDDSVLYEPESMLERRRNHKQLVEEKKIPAGKDRTYLIYVSVPSKEKDADAENDLILEEFEFQLDTEGKHYKFQFGHTSLQIFDWRKYQRMLRHLKNQAFQKGLKNDDQAKIATKKPIETYERPEPWCDLDEFPDLVNVFDMDTFIERQFVEKMLTLYKPRPTDGVGYVYILQRQTDVKKKQEGAIDHILLHKIGMTYKEPVKRVSQQSRANREEYHILAWFKTSYHKFLEYACHRYFQDCRVVKTDSKDGGTEWFLVEPTQLLPGVQKIRKALYYMFDDKHGWKPPAEADIISK